jgi:hypothetical protein
MSSFVISTDRILAKDKTARIGYSVVVQMIPVPVRGTTGG